MGGFISRSLQGAGNLGGGGGLKRFPGLCRGLSASGFQLQGSKIGACKNWAGSWHRS